MILTSIINFIVIVIDLHLGMGGKTQVGLEQPSVAGLLGLLGIVADLG